MGERYGRARASAALVVSLALMVGIAGTASAATVIGEWKLKGGLKNAAGTALKMAKVGDVSFPKVDVKGTSRRALRFDAGEGLRLTKIPRTARGTYSVSAWFEFDDVEGYRRILSFGPNDRDDGLYVESGYIDLYPNPEKDLGLVADEWVRVHVTRKGSTGRMKVYVNGVKQLSYLDEEKAYKLRKGIMVFFQDNLVGSGTEEHGSGTAASIKVWRGVKAP